MTRTNLPTRGVILSSQKLANPDCAIYVNAEKSNERTTVVGIDFERLQLGKLENLVPENDHVVSHHRNVEYLLYRLTEPISDAIRAEVGYNVTAELIYTYDRIRIELAVTMTDVGAVSNRLVALLGEQPYCLTVATHH